VVSGSTLSFTGVGTVVVTATQAGNAIYLAATPVTATIVVNAAGGFTLASATPTLSVVQGQTVSTILTLTPTNGYAGTITFSCQGLPANARCIFSAVSENLTGNNQPVSVGLTLETNVLQAGIGAGIRPGQNAPRPILPALAFWIPGGMTGLAALGRKRKLRKAGQRWLQLCLLIVATGAIAVGLTGCGTNYNEGTPTGSSRVTVLATGTSNGAVTMNTAVLTLTITK
jgi:hypothetical protein